MLGAKLRAALRSLKEKCSVQRMLILLAIIVVICLAIGCFLIWKTIKQDHEIDCLKEKVERLKKLNKTELYLRRLIDNPTADIPNRIQQIKTGNKSSPGTRHDLRQSFKDIKYHLDVLVDTVGNLSEVVSRINSSSHSTISRLGKNLNGTKKHLIRLRNRLTRLNYSLHADMIPFTVAAVDDLRQELDLLRNSTTAKVSELWQHWHRTDAEIEDVIKLIKQQNETLHFKIAYHSDILYSELKDVEKKQLKFHNATKINLKAFRGELNRTRHGLQTHFDNQIARVNQTWRKAVEDIDRQLRLSMRKINVKVDGVKKDLQKSINNYINEQNKMKDDFLKTKAGFQEKDKKHDSAISGQASKMDSMEDRIAEVEGKLDSKTISMEKKLQNLQSIVNNMKNKVDRVFASNVSFIFVLLHVLYQFC